MNKFAIITILLIMVSIFLAYSSNNMTNAQLENYGNYSDKPMAKELYQVTPFIFYVFILIIVIGLITKLKK
jgi:hypothetical protein